MGSGGSQKSSGTQHSQPWIGQQKFLREMYGMAQQAATGGGPLEYYPGQTYAERDPAYARALGQTEAIARSDDIPGYATDLWRDTAQGRYLSPESNPWLDATFNRASERVGEAWNRNVLPTLESRFQGAGRAHSGAYGGAVSRASDVLGDQLEDLATSIYGQNYQQERGRQMHALQMAPQVQAQQYAPMEALREVGRERESYDQLRIDDLIARFEFARDEPYMRAERYGGLLGQPVMQTTGRQSARSDSSLWGWLGF